GARTLRGAQVTLVELNRTVRADDGGRYRFTGVPAGQYTLRATYSGVRAFEAKVSVAETETLTENIALGDPSSDVLVMGQRATLFSSLSRQRSADGVESVLTRDGVGQFPDQNVAESLRRLPGVNILNDQGEGRFVSVRGLDPNLNASSINGVRIPAPESDVRSVALDVISSDQIESIEVKKTLTPDMDGDTIGASIEIKTASAFDRKKDLLTVRVEGSYNDRQDALTPKADMSFATLLNDKVGIAGGLSYYKRKFATDGIETGGWTTANDGTVYTEEPEYRDYDVERERMNASLSFDFKPSDTTTLYLRGIYSQFDDQEYRRRLAFVFDGAPSAASGDRVSFSDADDRIEVRRDVKDRFERQRIRSLTGGGETDIGPWNLKYSAAYSKSSERENGSLDPTRFRARFDGDGVAVDYDYSDRRRIAFNVTSGEDLFLDPSEYGFNRVERTALSNSVDREYSARGDISRAFPLAAGEFTLQAGVKSRWRTKSYDFDMDYYGDFDGDYTLADVLGRQTYQFYDISPVPGKKAPTDFFYSNLDRFELDPFESGFNSVTSDYRAKEDILAGYLLGRFDSTAVRVIGGVRVERTRNRLTGNLVEVFEDEADGSCGELYCVTLAGFRRSYTNWLPSLNARFAPARDVVLRAGVSKSLVRPNLRDMAPRFTINEDREAEFGNPNLKPYQSWNFDASAEYYFSRDGAISANVFHKRIKDFIATALFTDPSQDPFGGTYNGISYGQLRVATNGDTATVTGAEFIFSQAMRFLPAPFDGLLVNLNYTFTDADGTLPDGRDIPLPAASRHTFNTVLGYEKGPVSIRLAGTYRGRYLDEVSDSADTDRYVDKHFQLDLSAKYNITKSIQIFGDWINVNNARYFAYQNYANSRRLLQFEEYGWTAKGGVKVTF
ncbi:TonB-dependent receptor, partial [Sphingomonas sp.]|uniref:TonB-dependent receptor n=1 Tax=Sphingomonas sp. TaxID=28214 RepID=UPI003B3A3555